MPYGPILRDGFQLPFQGFQRFVLHPVKEIPFFGLVIEDNKGVNVPLDQEIGEINAI
jgi:hypothetical protein